VLLQKRVCLRICLNQIKDYCVKISNIEKFLDLEAWNIFKVVHEEKVAKSTCVFCDEFCLADTDKPSIECETCNPIGPQRRQMQ
jgi:hypothetical protein